MVSIKKYCDKISDEQIWLTDNTKSYKPDDFKQVQRGAIISCKNELYVEWCNNICETIKDNLSKVGKGWYNMHETNTETYEFSKLKKFLTIVKFMMQEAILKLAKKSVMLFESKMISNVPVQVDIKTINDVYLV